MEEAALAQTRVSKAQAREILQTSLPIPGDVQQDLNRHLLAIGSASRLKSLQASFLPGNTVERSLCEHVC